MEGAWSLLSSRTSLRSFGRASRNHTSWPSQVNDQSNGARTSSQPSELAPPLNNRLYQESRYKTELCRQFQELQTCEYGLRCLFAHGESELRPLPHRHPKFKTEKCSAYHEYGFCSFGPRCSFIHERVDPYAILSNIAKALPAEYKAKASAHLWDSESVESMSYSAETSEPSDSSTDRSESPFGFYYDDSDIEHLSSDFSFYLTPYYELDELTFYQELPLITSPSFDVAETRLPVFLNICSKRDSN